jgi:hypothetical protein
MIKFINSLQAWTQPQFETTFKQDVRALAPGLLPLQAALAYSSHVSDSAIDPVVLATSETAAVIRVKTAIFYSGVIAGSCCADDPTPICDQPEYCELEFEIDKGTAEVNILLLPRAS